MKQVSTTINTVVRSFSSISPRWPFSKYRLVLILTVIAILVSSCQKENHQKKTVQFKAEFQIIIGSDNQITGTGQGTYIGKSTLVVNDNDANFPLLTGTQIITAANADQLFSSHSGSAIGPDKNGILLITLNNIITGGTGRFAGATGSFIAKGITNTLNGTGSVTFSGTISY